MYVVMTLTRPKVVMIRFMSGILSIHRGMRSITHPSATKFQGFPRIITPTSFYFNSCLKVTNIYYPGVTPNFNSPCQGFSRLIRWGYVHHILIQGYVPGWIRFVRQDLVCVHSDDIDLCGSFA